MMPVYLDEQLASGTFEHMLDELIDSQMDLRIFDSKYGPAKLYSNDLTGATGFPKGIQTDLETTLKEAFSQSVETRSSELKP